MMLYTSSTYGWPMYGAWVQYMYLTHGDSGSPVFESYPCNGCTTRAAGIAVNSADSTGSMMVPSVYGVMGLGVNIRFS
jgi:hypothetical protein